MKSSTILQKFLKGYAVLEEVESPINGRIQVWEDWFGRKRLVVGGISQSGAPVEKIWREALRPISNFKFPISNCLILGLGAGSAVWVINQYFPEAKITGVEIDSEVIRLGRKFFGLDGISNLKVLEQDAISSINNQQLAINNFDLILVDMFLGNQIPTAAEDESFLKNLKKSLNKNGVVIFNRLYYGNKKEKTDKFIKILRNFFEKVEAKKFATNKLILCHQ